MHVIHAGQHARALQPGAADFLVGSSEAWEGLPEGIWGFQGSVCLDSEQLTSPWNCGVGVHARAERNSAQHRQDIMASFWQAVSLLISYAFCTLWLGNCMQRQASLSDLVKFALQHKFVYNITAPCMQACWSLSLCCCRLAWQFASPWQLWCTCTHCLSEEIIYLHVLLVCTASPWQSRKRTQLQVIGHSQVKLIVETVSEHICNLL